MNQKYTFGLCLVFVGTALAQVPPSHPLFGPDAVHEIHLRFAEPDWFQKLTDNYVDVREEGDYLSASFEWGSIKFNSIGVRFKGNSSYKAAQTDKKPFRLKFNEFVKGQKIQGIGAINLNNAWADPSFVREKPYSELAEALGLKAPRYNFATLYINGQYWGLYGLGEVINDDFLKDYFGSGDEDEGNLYKGNIGATFEYLGTDSTPYRRDWEKQTNEKADDWSDLIELCRILNESTPSNLRANLEPIADVDSFLAALVLDNATVNLDSYVSTAQNFQIYRRPSDGRWVWLVWDPSLGFGSLGRGIPVEGLQQLPVFWTTSTIGGFGNAGTERPLATKLWAVPEYRQRYLKIYQKFVEKIFRPQQVLARMTEMRQLIRPFVLAENQRLVTAQQFELAMTSPASGVLGDEVDELSAPGLEPFIKGRVAYLKTLLAFIAPSEIQLTAGTSALIFSQSQGGAAATQDLPISASGTDPVPFYSARATTNSGGNWLRISPTGGALPGAIEVSVDGGQLGAGIYNANIQIDASAAVNSITIPVSLLVANDELSRQQPFVSSVVNAASYARDGVAPGEMITLFGSNLGPRELAFGKFANGAWSSTVGSVQVTFDGVPAPILHASEGQTTVVVPAHVAGNSRTAIRIAVANQWSTVMEQLVLPASPGIFTIQANGQGQGAILNQSMRLNNLTSPAAEGSTVSIFFTGGGQTNNRGDIASPVSVLIGGQPATVTYSGAAPGNVPGLYQVNAVIPLGVPSGAISAQVLVGGISSQTRVTIAVQ